MAHDDLQVDESESGTRARTEGRKKPVRLILDSLPAHKCSIVRDYVASTKWRLSLHFLPGNAPDLNPDELVWSHVKRTGTARQPLQKGEKLRGRIAQNSPPFAMIQPWSAHSSKLLL
jgi:transposase